MQIDTQLYPTSVLQADLREFIHGHEIAIPFTSLTHVSCRSHVSWQLEPRYWVMNFVINCAQANWNMPNVVVYMYVHFFLLIFMRWWLMRPCFLEWRVCKHLSCGFSKPKGSIDTCSTKTLNSLIFGFQLVAVACFCIRGSKFGETCEVWSAMVNAAVEGTVAFSR